MREELDALRLRVGEQDRLCREKDTEIASLKDLAGNLNAQCQRMKQQLMQLQNLRNV
jgi:hypothetical protein